MSKLWGGRFTKETNKIVEKETASIGFDYKLAEQDIEGSLAHVYMLESQGILTKHEAAQIEQGLFTVQKKLRDGQLSFSPEHEDIHMNIEKHLIDEIGAVGGKLHTGRSRNDQVATDMHLYLLNKTEQIMTKLADVQQAIYDLSGEHTDTILPGYTHLQRAQPISFAHHMLAYFWMFERDYGRLNDSLKRISWSPLGAGALAGTTFPIDREDTARRLGFEAVYPNSMDAVSDRDFIVEFMSAASLIMTHISRLSEEFVIWMSEEFSFIELDDSFCTGSSIMPQKKNPDVPELLRARTGRVNGNLVGLLTVLKGLPLAYNKDMQEDKEGMFDTVHTVETALDMLAPMIASMTVNRETMQRAVHTDYSNATDIADYLVNKGLPFREAHEVIGKIVLYGLNENKYLLDLTLEEFQAFHTSFEEDIFSVLEPRSVMNARTSEGGTSETAVKEQLKQAGRTLEKKTE
ncbi:argininosuccinate lyase [Salisediminibacterium halotolerans]|uniref:argininosuccinate lyase n=1 Tax=Salisediminibacterium halotolerans TaxID=517425 RepID=UPI000EABD5F6|nr:argininosuccinate lyase [Salisediminibacterium halotolerans]RLJ81034.1 argininosuccinate lyase [Actinophytocola xinjiangensis]RPE87876.1 argininosuccinate lyase [Salisediminibacterium halotolerans]TWG37927.1 argininosuccinate lyase [Salisediminibacterium halotolerans]GEL08248.1 argininosuccinate lyase [Salisediminibacterium halotolerans]